jgi:hypothetical protein
VSDSGRVTLERKAIAQLIGKVFIQKAAVNLLSTVRLFPCACCWYILMINQQLVVLGMCPDTLLAVVIVHYRSQIMQF